MMEYNFNHLVATRITRLTRPSISFIESVEDSLIPPTDKIFISDEFTCSNDIAEIPSEFGNMFTFNTKFG